MKEMIEKLYPFSGIEAFLSTSEEVSFTKAYPTVKAFLQDIDFEEFEVVTITPSRNKFGIYLKNKGRC